MTEEKEIINEQSEAALPNTVSIDETLKDWVPYPEHTIVTLPTEAGQKAAVEALSMIKDRSYAGRNPSLGKMINCQFCGMRHRQNDTVMKCEQKFITELTPPEGLTTLTARQIFGAKAFNKRRRTDRKRPKSKMHHSLRVILDARKKKDADKA